MAARRLTWTDEVVALLDVWSDTSVQAELQGAYRNDHIYHRIVSELAARGFQRNVKQAYRRSGAGVESDECVTQADFQFFSQLHRVLGSRAVVNPPLVHQIRESSATYAKFPLKPASFYPGTMP